VKSRSSGNSFGSELKDIIAPIPTTISNCGTIAVKKVTVPASDTATQFTYSGDAGAQTLTNGQTSTAVSVVPGSYTETEAAKTGWDLTGLTCDDSDSTGNTSTRIATFHVAAGENVVCTYTNTQRGTIVIKKVTDPSSDTSTSFGFTPGGGLGTTGFNLTNGGTPKTYSNVVPGAGNSNSVSENTPPFGWVLTSATCDNASLVTDITVAPGGTTTCTFTNTLQHGALQITKQSIKSGNAKLAGAEFSITGPGGYSQTGLVSDASGIVCVEGLSIGDYSVTETKAPDHYTIDHTAPVVKTVTATGAKCSDSPFGGEKLTFNDTPKTDLDIKVASQDTGSGGSSSTITCTNDVGGSNIGNSPKTGNSAEVTANDLAPGNYTCKVLIDP
jgi:hypothetical protein